MLRGRGNVLGGRSNVLSGRGNVLGRGHDMLLLAVHQVAVSAIRVDVADLAGHRQGGEAQGEGCGELHGSGWIPNKD